MDKIKKNLIASLIRSNAFWSYDKYYINSESVKDNLLIELVLKYADVNEIKQLFTLFPQNNIQEIWEKRLIPDEQLYKLNFYLGSCFFNIPNVKKHIKEKSKTYSRYEILKKLASRNEISIS